MIEAEAQRWVRDRFGQDGEARMMALAGLVAEEAGRQNLIAPSTLATIWSRHIVDSAQLIGLADDAPGIWLDIGTGAGFPGLVVAALTDRPIHLVEPRRRRADFLTAAAIGLGIADRVIISTSKVESVADQAAAVISARAVAPLVDLLASARHCATDGTIWLLPKGKGAREEVATARRTWHGVFHVEQSITDPDSLIVLAKGVSRR